MPKITDDDDHGDNDNGDNDVNDENNDDNDGDNAKDVDKNLEEIEEKKLKAIGKSRLDYEVLVDDLEKSVSEIN